LVFVMLVLFTPYGCEGTNAKAGGGECPPAFIVRASQVIL